MKAEDAAIRYLSGLRILSSLILTNLSRYVSYHVLKKFIFDGTEESISIISPYTNYNNTTHNLWRTIEIG